MPEQVGRVRQINATVYDTYGGNIGPVATRVGGPGESVTVSFVPNQAANGSTDYELVPYAEQVSPRPVINLRIYQGLGERLADLAASKQVYEATGVWGQVYNLEVDSVTWQPRQVDVHCRNTGNPQTLYVFILSAQFDIDLLVRQTGGAPPTAPPPGAGFRIRWTRRLQRADVQYNRLGVRGHLTLQRLGFQARPHLLVGLRRRVSIDRERGGVLDEHEYWWARWPGLDDAGNEIYLRVGQGHVGGPERIGPG